MPSEPTVGPRPRKVPRASSILIHSPYLADEADHPRAAAMGLDFWSTAPGTRTPLPWRHSVAGGDVHRWLQQGTSRVHMRAGCPVCRGYTASATTSLAACAPDLARQWHPTRNGTRTADHVTPGSRRVAWWLCDECGHTWSARISSRGLDGNGCPRCAGQVAEPGDPATLAVAQPELFAELDLDGVARLSLDPLAVHVRSNRQLPWVCVHHPRHRWSATPAARMNGCKCPRCPSLAQSSRVERTLLALVLQRCGDAVGNAPAGDVRWLDRRGRSLRARCDIVVPSLRLVVEYDGLRFHSVTDRRRCDHSKTQALLADGWRVVRLRENTATRRLVDLDITDHDLLQVQHRYGDRLSLVVDSVLAWIESRAG